MLLRVVISTEVILVSRDGSRILSHTIHVQAPCLKAQRDILQALQVLQGQRLEVEAGILRPPSSVQLQLESSKRRSCCSRGSGTASPCSRKVN